MRKTPALFIGHGSPMNLIETNLYTDAWQRIGRQLPRPRALLVISAHWYFGATAVTAMEHPRTIHDFYGFPEALFKFQYPAPGDPDLAREISQLALPTWIGLDRDQWGLDHGAWSVLAHLFPEADIPVLQLSINALRPLDFHLELATRLAPLRERGVMILASGNVVHNLPMMQRQDKDFGYDWAQRFDDAVAEQLVQNPGDILRLLDHPDYALASPTPDHFIPLLYLAGLAAADESPVETLLRGCTMGAISMSSYGIDTGLQAA